MNKVFLIGRLTRDPELRYTDSNVAVAGFTLAVNRDYKNQNGEYEADFINIVVWKNQAENVNKYLSKGDQCAVEGRLQTRSYEMDNGQRRYITEVVANNIQFLEPKKKENKENKNDNSLQEESNPFAEFGEQISINPDELPFD